MKLTENRIKFLQAFRELELFRIRSGKTTCVSAPEVARHIGEQARKEGDTAWRITGSSAQTYMQDLAIGGYVVYEEGLDRSFRLTDKARNTLVDLRGARLACELAAAE